jgi:hypothetical protein
MTSIIATTTTGCAVISVGTADNPVMPQAATHAHGTTAAMTVQNELGRQFIVRL